MVLIINLWNLVTLLSTLMCSSFRMDHIASWLQELLPFVNDNSLLIRIWQKPGIPCPMDTFLVFMCIWQIIYLQAKAVNRTMSANTVHVPLLAKSTISTKLQYAGTYLIPTQGLSKVYLSKTVTCLDQQGLTLSVLSKLSNTAKTKSLIFFNIIILHCKCIYTL